MTGTQREPIWKGSTCVLFAKFDRLTSRLRGQRSWLANVHSYGLTTNTCLPAARAAPHSSKAPHCLSPHANRTCPRLAAVAGWHGTQTTAAAFCRGALSQSTEISMHSKLLAIASAGVLLMAGTAAWAQSSTVEKTPGHIMQQRTPQAKSTGPGASEYAPGHLKRKSKSQSASQVTPSHRTAPTTTGIRTR
jgi:hypothetical protein